MFSRFKNRVRGLLMGYLGVDGLLVARAKLIAENEALRKENIVFRDGNRALADELESYKKGREFISAFLEDPVPVDTEKRKLFVASVAGVYSVYLEPKLRHMISKALSLLESPTNDREYDQAVKGAVYFGRELMIWFRSMVNEHVSYQQSDESK